MKSRPSMPRPSILLVAIQIALWAIWTYLVGMWPDMPNRRPEELFSTRLAALEYIAREAQRKADEAMKAVEEERNR